MSRGLLGRLRGDRRGVVALEFAIVVPMWIIILVGFSELYLYMRAVAVIERTSATVADLLARRQTLGDCGLTDDSAYLGTYFEVAERVAAPLPLSTRGEVIAAGVVDSGNGPTIAWQRRSETQLNESSSLGRDGGPASLPATQGKVPNPAVAGDTLIVAQVLYRFDPFEGVRFALPGVPGEVTIRRISYARARFGALGAITPIPGCTAPATL